MSKRTIVTVFGGILMAALVCGCAGMGKGLSDEELVMGQLQALVDALLAKDVDAAKALLSDDWYHPEVGGKEVAMDYIEQGVDMGVMDDAEVDLESAEVEVEGDTATVYPVEASSPMGSVTVQLDFKKEDGTWLLIGGDAEGI